MIHRLAIGVAALLALAPAPAGAQAELPLDVHARLFAGNASEVETFERCAVDNALCALTLARWERERDRPNLAAQHLRRAVAIGNRYAPLALAFLHSDAGESVDAWAWAYLAWMLDDPDGSLPEAETRDLFSYRLLAMHQAALDAAGRARARARANDLLAAHFETLDRAAARARAAGPVLEPIRRPPPTYPARLADRGIEGFAIAYAEVGHNGRVVAAVPVYATHEPFGRAAARVLRTWRFANDDDAGEPVGLVQVIEYQLRDR